MNYSLAREQDWNNAWDKVKHFDIASRDNIIRVWLEKYFIVLENEKKSVLEIGCFPGGYLAVFGELGYELNGIDLYLRVNTELPLWLGSKNYKIGGFCQSDFFKYRENRKFDVVCSFGFIEHFTDFEDVLIKHSSLVKDGGYIVITSPNYRGFVQRILHLTLNTTVYKAYNIPSMNPFAWKNIVEKLGYEAIFCGGFGNFSFWTECEHRNFMQKILSRLIMKASVVLNLTKLPNSRFYSPYYGLIAKKRETKL
jgi:SAM-dependent methyltransferase